MSYDNKISLSRVAMPSSPLSLSSNSCLPSLSHLHQAALAKIIKRSVGGIDLSMCCAMAWRTVWSCISEACQPRWLRLKSLGIEEWDLLCTLALSQTVKGAQYDLDHCQIVGAIPWDERKERKLTFNS